MATLDDVSRNSKVVVYNPDTKLESASVSNNTQGVKLENATFIKMVTGVPSGDKQGTVVYSTDQNKLYIATAFDTYVTFTKDA